MFTATAAAFDASIRRAIAEHRITPDEARVARAVKAVRPGTAFDNLLEAARRLHADGIMPHQIRTNYRAAGITFDVVQAALGLGEPAGIARARRQMDHERNGGEPTTDV